MSTNTSFNYYEFRFVKNYYAKDNSISKKLYSFKSPKTKQDYFLWVEFYPYSFIAIKFHLKSHRHSKNKYHKLTDYNEARPIIFTCLKILLEVNSEFNTHSFGFIGANTNDWIKRKNKYGVFERKKIVEPEYNTKRYNRYKRILITFISEKDFVHVQNKDKSAYLLLRRSQLEQNPNLENDIMLYFADNFDTLMENS
jgi:hypothetical protein